MNEEMLVRAAKNFGTPLYIYDLKEIENRIHKVQKTLEGVEHRIFFAFKSNSNFHLLKRMRAFGCGADVVSMSEYKMAKSVGFTSDEMVINGNGKTEDELGIYLKDKVRYINVDSMEEVERFPKNLSARVAIRINPNVDAKTHPHISTGLRENKFGVDMKEASKLIHTLPANLKLVGLHCHIGSQITDVSPFIDTLNSLKLFIDKEDLKLEFLNIGGGWGIDYLHNGTELSTEKYREKIVPLLKKFGIPIHLELGRFIISPAGYLVTKVLEIKHSSFKNFIAVDASMSTFLRPILYNAHHHIEFLSNGSKILVDVVGRVCESGDTFGKNREVKTPKVGDLGIIYDVGAYGYSMASNYNLSLRPAEVTFDGKDFKLIRRRETFDDLIRL